MPDVPSILPEIDSFLRRGKSVRKLKVPTLKDLPEPLREAAEAIAGITGSWNPVEIYTAEPRGRQQEKQKFLHSFHRGRVYQPSFHYDYAESFALGDSRDTLCSLLETVRRYKAQERVWSFIRATLFHKIKDDLATCDLVEGIQQKDEGLIAKAVQYKYPGVDPVVLQFAEKDWESYADHDKKFAVSEPGLLHDAEKEYLRHLIFDAGGMKEAFEWALAEYGILRVGKRKDGYQVMVDRRATAIDVRDKSVHGPTVFIPEHARETGEDLLALMAHEIEGHARQSWNGEQFLLFGGGPLKIDDETLYEGLAMRYEHSFRQRYFGTEGEHHYLDYYVFAVHRAERGGSFHDVFVDQLERRLRILLRIPRTAAFSHAQVRHSELYSAAEAAAWGTAYRVMRGHVDMRNPLSFAMAKDLAYFRGWLLDHQLRESGHGHINEIAVSTIGQLRVLAEFAIDEADLPCPYKDVASVYMRRLLEKMPGTGKFAAKQRL